MNLSETNKYSRKVYGLGCEEMSVNEVRGFVLFCFFNVVMCCVEGGYGERGKVGLMGLIPNSYRLRG